MIQEGEETLLGKTTSSTEDQKMEVKVKAIRTTKEQRILLAHLFADYLTGSMTTEDLRTKIRKIQAG